MQSLSTIDTEMQYWLEVVHSNTAFIHCDATFEYTGHANAVFLMSSLDVVLIKKIFIVMQPLNTLDTGIQYMCNVFTRYYAQKYSLYCSAMIEHNRFRNAICLYCFHWMLCH